MLPCRLPMSRSRCAVFAACLAGPPLLWRTWPSSPAVEEKLQAVIQKEMLTTMRALLAFLKVNLFMRKVNITLIRP